jgi:hypothetical protein
MPRRYNVSRGAVLDIGLRIMKEVEIEGLDLALHGEDVQ